MPAPSTASAPAPASPPISPGAARLLAEVHAAPGQWTPESLAHARGWSSDLTAREATELRRAGLLRAADAVTLRPGVSIEDIPVRDDTARAVYLALLDGHGTVGDIARAFGELDSTRLRGRIRAAVARMAGLGVAWPARRMVASSTFLLD